jgi:hypothetical protein
MRRAQKITLKEIRESGPTRLIVYCGEYKCAHSVDAKPWGDDVRISDPEPRFICQVCGHRGADIRPFFDGRRRASCNQSVTNLRQIWLAGI